MTILKNRIIEEKAMKPRSLKPEAINTGSMADIAFLLLIFFLVSTTILQEQGLMLKLPPKPEEQSTAKISERNLFKILINSNNQYLVRGEVMPDISGLRSQVKTFVVNRGAIPSLSDHPEKAIISIKANRGTEYQYFIEVLDEVKEAYYELYGEKLGMTAEAYRSLNHNDPSQYQLYLKGKEGLPMNISIAEPD